jgi:hypothetical protein
MPCMRALPAWCSTSGPIGVTLRKAGMLSEIYEKARPCSPALRGLRHHMQDHKGTRFARCDRPPAKSPRRVVRRVHECLVRVRHGSLAMATSVRSNARLRGTASNKSDRRYVLSGSAIRCDHLDELPDITPTLRNRAGHRNAYHIEPVKPSRRAQPGSAALLFSNRSNPARPVRHKRSLMSAGRERKQFENRRLIFS